MNVSKPEAGQWWFYGSAGPGDSAHKAAVFIVGTDSSGRIIAQACNNGLPVVFGSMLSQAYHEPRCTGWDWVVPADPTPPANQPDPDEWVVLDPVKYADHVPRTGIDWFIGMSDEWTLQASYHDSRTVGDHFRWCGKPHRCRRRDLPPEKQPAQSSPLKASDLKAVCDDVIRWRNEQWPKYYHASFKANQIAFVRRDNATQYTPVMYDGTELKKQPWFGNDNCRIELTEAEAMALLKKPEPQPAKSRVRLWKNNYGSVMSNDDCEHLEGWQEIHHDAEGFYVEGGQS